MQPLSAPWRTIPFSQEGFRVTKEGISKRNSYLQPVIRQTQRWRTRTWIFKSLIMKIRCYYMQRTSMWNTTVHTHRSFRTRPQMASLKLLALNGNTLSTLRTSILCWKMKSYIWRVSPRCVANCSALCTHRRDTNPVHRLPKSSAVVCGYTWDETKFCQGLY